MLNNVRLQKERDRGGEKRKQVSKQTGKVDRWI